MRRGFGIAALLLGTVAIAPSCSSSYGSSGNANDGCPDGFGDCDPTTPGCETDIKTSASHCGFCGNVCTPHANGFPTCGDRKCGIGCNTGFGDCNGSIDDGCETKTDDDPKNCGACGNACGVVSPDCSGGKCRVACDQTHGDCNAMPGDGCEVDITNDATHCGSCQKACDKGMLCVMGTCTLAHSCKEIFASVPRPPSGVYEIGPDDVGPGASFKAYCELDPAQDGGGWTLVLKAANDDTQKFNANIWSLKSALNATSADLDDTPARLPSYWMLAMDDVRVGLKEGASPARWLVIHESAPSLWSILNDESVATPSAVGRDVWLGLVTTPSAQQYCNLEGFNVRGSQNISVRIGIIFNEQMDCGTPDSFIGIGSNINTVYSGHYNNQTNTKRAMTGYVMVR